MQDKPVSVKPNGQIACDRRLDSVLDGMRDVPVSDTGALSCKQQAASSYTEKAMSKAHNVILYRAARA